MKNFAPDRLENYGVFDADVIDRTNEMADKIRSFETHHDLLKDLGAQTISATFEGYNPSEILVIPAQGSDRRGVLPIGLGIANPIDGGQRFQAAAVAMMVPDYDVVAFGNPSGGDFDGGVLSYKHAKIVKNGELWPITDPMERYLEEKNYDEVLPVGYSFGADISAELAVSKSLPISGHVAIESASATKKFPLFKGIDFIKTSSPFSGYVADSRMSAFVEARKDSLSAKDFNLGIFKLSNLACTFAVSRGRYEEAIGDVLQARNGIVHTGFWGVSSEFGNGTSMPEIYDRLAATFGARAIGHAMNGQTHAFANHIPTQMAMVAQGVKNATN